MKFIFSRHTRHLPWLQMKGSWAFRLLYHAAVMHLGWIRVSDSCWSKDPKIISLYFRQMSFRQKLLSKYDERQLRFLIYTKCKQSIRLTINVYSCQKMLFCLNWKKETKHTNIISMKPVLVHDYNLDIPYGIDNSSFYFVYRSVPKMKWQSIN